MIVSDVSADGYAKVVGGVIGTCTLIGIVSGLYVRFVHQRVRSAVKATAAGKLWSGLTNVVDNFPALAASVTELKTATDRIPAIAERVKSFEQIAKSFPGVASSVERLDKEFSTNGGKTILDMILRNGDRLQSIDRQQRLQTVVMNMFAETIDEATVIANADGEPEMVTAGFTAMTGLNINGMLNDGWRLMVHPDDIDRVVRKWNHSRSTGKPFIDKFRIRNVNHPEHGWFRVYNVAIPIVGRGGWKGVFTRWADRIKNSPIVTPRTNIPVDSAMHEIEDGDDGDDG